MRSRGNVKKRVGHLDIEGEVWIGEINLGNNLQMLVKVTCLDEIPRVRTGRRRTEGLSCAEVRELENSAEELGSPEENQTM